MNFDEVISFWFETLEPKQWWLKDTDLDNSIKQKFNNIYDQVVADQCVDWREHDEGRLAEIIVLDQFSRNIFRDQAAAFAQDAKARSLTDAAVKVGTHQRLALEKVNFLLLPYMHSESLQTHQMALPLFEQYTSENTHDFELRHFAIIEQFGRYPHRNEILGRPSTAQEIQFLTKPGSKF